MTHQIKEPKYICVKLHRKTILDKIAQQNNFGIVTNLQGTAELF